MLRVALDTNVVVSAIIADGKPRELLRKGIAGEFTLITSSWLLGEFVSVMRRPKFKASQDEIQRIVSALIQSNEVVARKSDFRVVRQDPKDDMVINTAYDGKADTIVSGDRYLLNIKEFRGIKIASISEASRQL